ncbi:MAG TPA: FAD-binding oxidoreductase [Candidatus Dorea intestinavium]|nr:FAD-binding oxidoreductase [Candidatus Dorea intestinavium]
MVMELNKEIIKAIIKDESRVKFDSAIEEKYQSDTLGRLKGHASALIFVKSTEEISGLLHYAYENNIPVTPRGVGTNLVGSTVPVEGGIIIDLSQMNHILEIDQETMTITVEPGILLSHLQSELATIGLFYPPDPGEKESTIGGNISTNAGGMRAVKYGVTRDYVKGLEVILADGRILNIGGKNIKDASGLSLTNLVVGSEGTLCIISKCLLKLIPAPEKTVSAIIPYQDLEAGIGSVLKILQADAHPTAVEFISRKVVSLGEEFTRISYPRQDAGSYILVTFDGHKEEIEHNTKRVKELAIKTGALDFIALTDEEAADIWKVRGALVKAVEAKSEQEPVDIVVPINKSAEFISFVNQLEEETGLQIVSFGHAGDGNVHLCVVRGTRDAAAWNEVLQVNMKQIYEKAYELGGLVSGEHGIGLTKRNYFFAGTPAINIEVMNSIKASLDHHFILNNKKSYLTGRGEN